MSQKSFLKFARLVNSRYLSSEAGPIHNSIKEKLTALFKPSHLNIVNESRNHVSNISQESHFRISIVSKEFENIETITRHRLIKKALQHEFDAGLHALSIVAKAPSEELKEQKSIPCIGKSKEIDLNN